MYIHVGRAMQLSLINRCSNSAMFEVAKQQVSKSVPCTCTCTCTFLKYRDHYTSNIIVAVPMQCCNYYVQVHIHVHVHVHVHLSNTQLVTTFTVNDP